MATASLACASGWSRLMGAFYASPGPASITKHSLVIAGPLHEGQEGIDVVEGPLVLPVDARALHAASREPANHVHAAVPRYGAAVLEVLADLDG